MKKGNGQYNERDLFAYMLQRCKTQMQTNKWIKMIPTTKTKDVVYTNDERASFVFDFESKRYSEQPAVVIKKDRIDDINIKAGSL